MVIFQYNLYTFGIHLWTLLYPKPCYNEPCYKEVVVYNLYNKPSDQPQNIKMNCILQIQEEIIIWLSPHILQVCQTPTKLTRNITKMYHNLFYNTKAGLQSKKKKTC